VLGTRSRPVTAGPGILRARILLAGYLVVVAVLTVPPVIEPWLLARATHLVRWLSGPAGRETARWVEPGLNVALFVPLALLLCWTLPRWSRWVVWLVCVLGSVAVELVQFLFLPGRTGSVVDVCTNGTGAAIGALLHWLVTRRRSAGDGRGQSVRQQ
jgi:hypothetical protein